MTWDRRRTIAAIATALVAGAGAGIAIGVADDDGEQPASETAAAPDPSVPSPLDESGPAPGDQADVEPPPLEEDPEGLKPGPTGEPPATTDERASAAAARSFVRALTLRNGRAVCESFVAGALDTVDFPHERGRCATTVQASLGYRSPQGAPVWKSSEMTDSVSARVDGDSARVVATVVTRYADVREPTIEDDIIYLELLDGRWQIEKPSATLYRAIGDTDVPPSVLAPPR